MGRKEGNRKGGKGRGGEGKKRKGGRRGRKEGEGETRHTIPAVLVVAKVWPDLCTLQLNNVIFWGYRVHVLENRIQN